MEVINRENVQQIMAQQGDPMISIFMPTRKIGQAVLENPIHLKNMIVRAEGMLREKGFGPGDIRDLLAPLQELVDNGDFWQHQGEGLAIFRSPDTLQTLRLPIPVEDCTMVNNRFYTRPLLPLLHGNGQFYLLALSLDNVRLFLGDRHGYEQVDLGDIPTSMQAALGDEQLTDTVNFHTNAQPVRGGERAAMFFGKGSSNESHKKEDIQRYFTMLEKGIYRLVNKHNLPMVLAGVEYLLPIYREKNRYPHILDEVITGNPQDRRVDEMHTEAWKLVAPRMNQVRLDAIEGYHLLARSNQATTDIRQIVPAAYFGQVDILLLPTETKIWGKFDPETQVVTVNEQFQVDDEDLTDLAAKFTLANNGLIYTYDVSEMPDGARVAATLRYSIINIDHSENQDKNQRKNELK